MSARKGSAYVPVMFLLAFLLAMGGWFTYDRSVCLDRFAKVSTAYDSLLVADAYSCGFAASDDLSRIHGQMIERCHSRGGYWLDKPIQVGETLTRCIVGPQSVPLETPR